MRRTLEALEGQTFKNFNVIIVDNSAKGVARGLPARILENPKNVGFGAAINQGVALSAGDYIACLNDDARPAPGWLQALVDALDASPRAGSAASRILLAGSHGRLDSAGLLLYPDGTAKQRGHGRPAEDFATSGEVLLASGCAALYRRTMLELTGGFDEEYFLYCEDSDLGLRAQLAGWSCSYVAEAQAEHDYSASAGRASRLKAFYVERNRLWTILKTFPLPVLLLAPFATLFRYWAHWRALRSGRGLAGELEKSGTGLRELVIIVWSAHWETLLHLKTLWRKRRQARRVASSSVREFWRMIRREHVSAREIASQ